MASGCQWVSSLSAAGRCCSASNAAYTTPVAPRPSSDSSRKRGVPEKEDEGGNIDADALMSGQTYAEALK